MQALSRLSLGLFMLASLGACGDDGTGGGDIDAAQGGIDAQNASEVASLVIQTEPVSSLAGAPLNVEVEARDADDALVENASITLSIESNPSSGTLGGTATQTTSAGIATFADVFIDKVGTGYTLLATAGAQTAETTGFDISAGALGGLAFVDQPVTTEAMASMATAVTVQLTDAFGNPVTDSSDAVTLSFANNAGEMLLHSSGNGPAMFESLDPTSLVGVGWAESFLPLETRSVLVHPEDGLLYAGVRSTPELFSFDRDNDAIVNLGETALNIRGLVFDSAGAGRFLSLDFDSSDLLEVDLAIATSTSLGSLSADPAIESFMDLAIDPTDNTFYAIALTSAETTTGRRLVIVDPVALTATEVGGFVDEGIASIAFRADGTLMAISGDGGTPVRNVYTVDKATAALTSLGALDNDVGDGEYIALVPARLRGTRSVSAIDGVASFPGLSVDAQGTGYTLQASSGAFISAPSSSFDITALQGLTGVVTLDAADQTVSEDVGTVTVSVSIDAAQSHDVILSYEASGPGADGLESDVSDERFFNIVIPAGQTSASRTITIVDDADAEVDENIVLTLQNAAMADGAGAITTHTINITDND